MNPGQKKVCGFKHFKFLVDVARVSDSSSCAKLIKLICSCLFNVTPCWVCCALSAFVCAVCRVLTITENNHNASTAISWKSFTTYALSSFLTDLTGT